MFKINDDLSIYVTRGDAVAFNLSATTDNGEAYLFKPNDIVRINIMEKKGCDEVVFQKGFKVEEETETVEISLTGDETKIGDIISKPTDYWYEIELNPFTNPKTIIGYDDETGAKIFKLFPEGEDADGITEEDIPIVDTELDLASDRPVQNQAIAYAVTNVINEVNATVENTLNEVNTMVDGVREELQNVPNAENMANLQSQITENKNSISTNTTNISNLQTSLGTTNTNIANLTTRIDEISNISNNLIKVNVISRENGMQVTMTNSDFTETKTITDGKAVFSLPKCGTYSLSNNMNAKTKIVEAFYYGEYEVRFNPWAVWGVDIDTTNSNPETSVTYTDDAVGIEPNSSEWDEIIGNKPCILENGVVLGYLNPNDYTKYENGTSAPITTVGKDVMVEFPKRGYKINTENNIVKIRLTDNPNASGYSYKPFSRNAEGDRDYFYYGAYKGFIDSSKLYSRCSSTPSYNQTRATFRTYAKNRGTGYAQNGFYQLTYLQCCYLLRFKNLNSQEAVGYGYVSNGNSGLISTGGTNTIGMNSELMSASDRTGGKKQIKCLGIEDFWGNIYQWVDGITTDSSRRLCVCHIPSSFSDSTSGTNINVIASGVSSDISNYLSKVQGSTDGGFVAKEVSGSDSTYFCDTAYLYASRVACFGGYWNSGAYAGAFTLPVNSSASDAYSSIGSRLMYV